MNAHPQNYKEGRVSEIDRIVIHVSQGSLKSTLDWFANPKSRVSTHYVASQNGTIYFPVSESNTAWHAGKLSMNARSIGIEFIGEGDDYQGTEAQLKAVAELIQDITGRYSFPIDDEHVIPHSAVKPTKCPAGVDLDALIRRARANKSANTLKTLVLHLPGFEPVIYRGKATYTLRDDKLDVRFGGQDEA